MLEAFSDQLDSNSNIARPRPCFSTGFAYVDAKSTRSQEFANAEGTSAKNLTARIAETI